VIKKKKKDKKDERWSYTKKKFNKATAATRFERERVVAATRDGKIRREGRTSGGNTTTETGG
jgi:hypothetical protein